MAEGCNTEEAFRGQELITGQSSYDSTCREQYGGNEGSQKPQTAFTLIILMP